MLKLNTFSSLVDMKEFHSAEHTGVPPVPADSISAIYCGLGKNLKIKGINVPST
jgi:hypothetical protein